MTDVGPQVWVHHTEPDPDVVDPVEHTEDSAPKKPSGGLWTSPRLESDGESVSSGWIEWMKGEYYDPYGDAQAWILYPEDDVEVYVIDDVYDAKKVMIPDEKHPQGFGRREMRIDYEAVFSEYDGIYLTREGQIDTRFPNHTYQNGERIKRATDLDPYNLYGWDCECILWDDWYFTDYECEGEVTIPDPDY